MSTRPHPHELRELARELRFPNSQEERATIAAVDKAVFSRVHDHERLLVDRASAAQSRARQTAAALIEVMCALEEEVGIPLAGGTAPSVALAERYAELQTTYEAIRHDLEIAIQAMEWAEESAIDPYANYMALMDKWPLVRPQL
jgi:hypothetical protein